jgi:opacity protein-like surface antigen
MKSFLLGTAALATLCLSLPALAADLPARVTKAPALIAAAAYDWSGFYLGVHAGYTFGEDDNISTTGQVAATSPTSRAAHARDRFVSIATASSAAARPVTTGNSRRTG